MRRVVDHLSVAELERLFVGCVQIPTKPAGYSDFKPASIPS